MTFKFKLLIILTLIFASSTLLQAQEIFEENSDSSQEEVKTKKKKKDDESFFKFEFEKLSKKFFTRFAIDAISVFVLIGLIYYKNYRRKELFLTFFAFNMVIFLMTFFLNKVDMGMGAAFGLFAVFSMLRYRTENISAKDMTYLFLVISIGLITAVSKLVALELVIINTAILLLVFLLEGDIFGKKEFSRIITYDNISMIKPENQQKLIDDLREKTGFNIHKIGIEKINFLSDSTSIKIYYYEDTNSQTSVPGTSNNDSDNK